MKLNSWLAQILILSLWLQMLAPPMVQAEEPKWEAKRAAIERNLKAAIQELGYLDGMGPNCSFNYTRSPCPGVISKTTQQTILDTQQRYKVRLSEIQKLSAPSKIADRSLEEKDLKGVSACTGAADTLSTDIKARKGAIDSLKTGFSTLHDALVKERQELFEESAAFKDKVSQCAGGISMIQSLLPKSPHDALVKLYSRAPDDTTYPNCPYTVIKRYYGLVGSSVNEADSIVNDTINKLSEYKKNLEASAVSVTAFAAKIETIKCDQASLPKPMPALSGGVSGAQPPPVAATAPSVASSSTTTQTDAANKAGTDSLSSATLDPKELSGVPPDLRSQAIASLEDSIGLPDAGADLKPQPAQAKLHQETTPATAATAVVLKGGDEASGGSVATATPATAATPPSTPLPVLPEPNTGGGGSGGGGGSQVAAAPSPSGGGAPESSAGNAPPASSAAGGDTQEGSSSWGSALKIGLGVAAVGALGVGGYMLYKSQQDSKEKKSSSSRGIASSTSASTGTDTSAEADGALIDELATLAQAAKANMAAATSKQSYQDIASGFASEAASKLSAIGVTTQVEQSTSGSGFTHSYLKLISATEGVGQATANRLFASEVYDPLSGASEPSL